MVTVFIWNYQGKSERWGHASMQVDQTYISWWPAKEGRVRSEIHPDIYSVDPIRSRSKKADEEAEGSAPDHTIHINGLDDTAIKAWWKSLSLNDENGRELPGPIQQWDTFKRNCSTVVSTGLRVGGGDKYSTWYKSWNLVWTPSDVLQYANSIHHGITTKKKK